MFKNKLLLLIYFLLYLSSFSINVFSQEAVIKTIVIDAGHGGHDSGCLGASKYEKTVCLSIALKLGELIKNSFPNLKVVYTRDKDIFIELHERAAIANRNKADLFICIHANSASPSAYGAETYVLGLHKTESQKQVAERENSIIKLEQDKGARYKNIDLSPDALIAIQLQMAIYLDQSIMFAERVQSEFKAIGRHDRGVRQAGFIVLHQTTMPSVLI
ncbi:MAG: N-acetylmuramoyl-L-alanine amidase, partial [Bacteroidota bacterium]